MSFFSGYKAFTSYNSDCDLGFCLQCFAELESASAQIRESLTGMKNNAVSSLDELKTGWNTPAGKDFFNKFDNDWVDQVDKYIETLQVFEDMLADLHGIFQNVADGANDIKF